MRTSRKSFLFKTLFFAFSLLVATQNGMALTIIRDFIGGTQGTNSVGTGNLTNIFNAAADIWELAIQDEHVVTLHYGWTPNGGGKHTLNAQGGSPNRETEGTIEFNNNGVPGNLSFYLDPTPYLNEEFMNYVQQSVDLGAGSVCATRYFQGPVSGPQVDLLTTAIHEIGHSLGLSTANNAFVAESNADLDVDVTAPRPFPGATIPMQTNEFGLVAHIAHVADRLAMSGSYAPGDRVLPSPVDILVNAQISGFKKLNLDLNPKLKINSGVTNVTLSWIQPIGQYELQENSNLANPDGWSSLPVTTTNGNYSVTIPRPTTNRFYRLHKL